MDESEIYDDDDDVMKTLTTKFIYEYRGVSRAYLG